MSESVIAGTLYIVSTPIGNLEDITFRAVSILSGVDLVAAEDTRKTKFLLNHYNLQKPLVSFFSFNEARRTPDLIAKLRSGTSIALVTDAGTPGISDPAFRIVRAALDESVPVVAIPGPSAFLAALIVSGLPVERFVFEGFLPVKKGRKTMLERLGSEERTIILYESPHRLLKTLRELHEHVGNREIAVARELTKKFEEVVRGRISDAIDHFSNHKVLGEFVIVLGGSSGDHPDSSG
ncbi:MAG: 16S rRNA (cytidine(1402)-2'-O)-methyltransferase [Bacteroidota bacterium]|jgi:16S rRNA (cytidine1402-2'-O)-methyltransferase